MSTIEKIKDLYKEPRLKYFESVLDLAIKNNVDVDIPNRASTNRSALAHSRFFDIASKIRIFSRGLHEENIFGESNVINSFKNRVATLVVDESYDKSKPLIEMVVKETRDNVEKNLKGSTFYKEVESLSNLHKASLMEIRVIDPETLVIPPYYIDVQYNKDAVAKTLIVKNKDAKEFVVKDLFSYEVVNKQILRIRTDNDKGHDSEALINCGKSNEEVEKYIVLYDFLKQQAVMV